MNDDRLVKIAYVPPQYHGLRVDVVLAELFPEFSRARLSAWLKAGLITLDDHTLKPKDKVWGGASVVMYVKDDIAPSSDEAEPISLNVIYEDETVLVINKPAGLVVHPGAGNPKHTLVNGLLYHDPDLQVLPRAGIIHRLDKDTTGLLLIAKTHLAHTSLTRQMQARTIQRQYFALVHGLVVSGARVETGYGRHPRNRLKMAVCKEGKLAITEFTVHQKFKSCTWLDVSLLTGRTHQIRVHMAHIHHPIVGDGLYGGRKRFPAGLKPSLYTLLEGFQRQALHAYALTFKHPVSQLPMTCHAPVPDDLQRLLKALEDTIE